MYFEEWYNDPSAHRGEDQRHFGSNRRCRSNHARIYARYPEIQRKKKTHDYEDADSGWNGVRSIVSMGRVTKKIQLDFIRSSPERKWAN